MDNGSAVTVFDASQRHQETLADYDSFKSMSELQRTELLLKLRSAGSPLGGDKDPLLHLAWNDAAFHEAATGGPFADALGQPDARTVDSVEQVQVAHGGVKVSRGLFKFGTTDGLHQALARTRDQLPWLRRGHQAHINSGDVASRCVHVNSVDCKLAFENLPYFSMT